VQALYKKEKETRNFDVVKTATLMLIARE